MSAHAEEAPDPDAVGQTSLHVRRAMAGEDESLKWVVQRLTPILLAHADYRLGPELRTRVDAVDLVNDAWVATLGKLGEIGAASDRMTPVLLKYLTTTITYRVARLLRDRKRPVQEQRSPDAVHEVVARCTGVFTQAVAGERHDAVRRAIAELAEIDREIVLLRGIEQLPSKSVAAALGISVAAVDKRYSRALERLRKNLSGSVFDELED